MQRADRQDADRAARLAMACAAVMIAQQVAAKAARDALFLSTFAIGTLPAMVAVSAVLSILFVLVAGRALSRWGPERMVPATFAAAGFGMFALAAIGTDRPRVAAVLLYLHLASFGSVVVSGFWSLLSERFDPRTARQRIGAIAGAGTFGGLVGGLLSAQAASRLGPAAILPALGIAHLACAVATRKVATPASPMPMRAPHTGLDLSTDLRSVARDPYLSLIAAHVVVGSMAATLIDYAFKAQAAARFHEGADLLRFFAGFYTVTGVLAFTAQVTLARVSLQKGGLARTLATLPAAVVAGAGGLLLAPGLVSAVALRGAEAVARSSLYRLAYELLYAPLPADRKRPTKAVIDVALDRAGEALGGGLVRLALLLAPTAILPVLGAGIAALGAAGLALAWRLHGAYVRTLEEALLTRAGPPADQAASEETVLALPVLGAADPLDTGLFVLALGSQGVRPTETTSVAREEAPPVRIASDAVLNRLAELRSGQPERVRRALRRGAGEPILAAQAIRLLAWDAVWSDATAALTPFAGRFAGQLADALLDPEEEFSVRRRLPRLLSEAGTAAAIEALLLGLEDRRFEVRFECARALMRLRERGWPGPSPSERAFAAVLREAAADRAVWEGRQILDDQPDEQWLALGDALRVRASRSLEHVFTLLGLVFPAEPLRVAFRALHTDDALLRGTALEYLDTILPAAVRSTLAPFLDDDRPATRPQRASAEVLQDLLRSHSSIEIRLTELAQAGASASRSAP